MPCELQILTQVLGAVAMALGVMSFQAKSGGRILVWQLAANCFWSVIFPTRQLRHKSSPKRGAAPCVRAYTVRRIFVSPPMEKPTFPLLPVPVAC